MGKPTDKNNHVMYIVARDYYLMSLLNEVAITQEQFEKMERFLYKRFQIANVNSMNRSMRRLPSKVLRPIRQDGNPNVRIPKRLHRRN